MEILNTSVMEMSEVEHDGSGLPVAWPLLHAGDNIVTRSRNMPVTLRLSREDIEGIVDYHKSKGTKIPIDCEHVVSNLAGKIGLDESELLRRLPRYSGVAGFGRLECRGDALYLAEVDYLPIGREVMAAGQFRYYSPTVRGLDGKSPLRCTSVALTNSPCLNGLASLAAAEDGDDDMTPEMVLEACARVKQEKEAKMDEEKQKEEQSGLLDVVREVMGTDVTVENLRAMLADLKAKAAGSTALEDKVKALECAEEKRAVEAVRKNALAKGKLTQAMLDREYFKKMGSAELSSYCQAVDDGVAVPVGVLELDETRVAPAPDTNEKMTLSEAIAKAPVQEMK